MAGERQSGSELIVYIDHSDIKAGKLDERKAGVGALVAFVEAVEPQLISYGFHIDDDASRMTVVAVHPDSASLELHLSVAGAEFQKLAPLLTLRSIEVYGRPSSKAMQMLSQKAAMLGDGGGVVAAGRFAGFTRVPEQRVPG